LAKAKAKEERDAKRGVDKDESESEVSGPDLSWLPDPDKVYGPKKSDESEEGSDSSGSGEESESEGEPVHR